MTGGRSHLFFVCISKNTYYFVNFMKDKKEASCMEEIRDLLNEIEMRLSNRYVVLDGDDNCICVKERKSGKHYDIFIKEAEE